MELEYNILVKKSAVCKCRTPHEVLVSGRQELACPLSVMIFFPHLWIYMDIVFEQLHLLMLGTELEAVPADTVSFELCIYSYA